MNMPPVSPSRRAPRRRNAAGFTLIEVLVAFIIFSFAMLGLAGLQTRMLTYSQSSLLRTQAMALTDDVLERMRLDRTNAINGNWDTQLEDGASTVPTGTRPFEFDLRDWKTEVEALLPQGRASIVMDAASGNTVIVTIEWNDSRGIDAANSAGTETFTTRSRL